MGFVVALLLRCCCSAWSFPHRYAMITYQVTFVVVGNTILTNVSGFGVVVGQGPWLRPHDFTEARAPKWAKVTTSPRRDAKGAVPSSNNNIVYRIYYLFNNNNNSHLGDAANIHLRGATLRIGILLPLRGRKVCLANTLLSPTTQPSRPIT